MRLRTTLLPFLVALAMWVAPAHAQPAFNWFSIDCGGSISTGGGLSLVGTIGQPDAAAPITGGVLSLTGGFRAFVPCPADFNGNGTTDVADIFAFLIAWFAGSPSADFNGSGGAPTVADIFVFLTAWFAGCPT
jgi:hypothetical protein